MLCISNNILLLKCPLCAAVFASIVENAIKKCNTILLGLLFERCLHVMDARVAIDSVAACGFISAR